jgi:hypothetical protein
MVFSHLDGTNNRVLLVTFSLREWKITGVPPCRQAVVCSLPDLDGSSRYENFKPAMKDNAAAMDDYLESRREGSNVH